MIEAAGGASTSSLKHFDSGGGCMVTTQQVDEYVDVVGKECFHGARYDLVGWLNGADQPEPPMTECFEAEGAREMLRYLCHDCFVWQGGVCDGWIFAWTARRSVCSVA